MSMTAGATGMLHHLVRQWAAGIGRSLDMIVEVLLMLVENVLGAADGGKARSHGAAGESAAREGKPLPLPIASALHGSTRAPRRRILRTSRWIASAQAPLRDRQAIR